MSASVAPVIPAATQPASTHPGRRQGAQSAHTPKEIRTEAKALDSGAVSEHFLEVLINSNTADKQPIECWRRPGVKSARLSGDNHIPDAAGYVEELAKYVEEQIPEVDGRPGFNVIFEFKSQYSTGSAHMKIQASISDLAHDCDKKARVAAVVLDTPALSDLQVIHLKTVGEREAVVVVTAEEVRDGKLNDELIRVAKIRQRLKKRIGPRGGYRPTARPDVAERGLAARISQRQLMAKLTKQYDASGATFR